MKGDYSALKSPCIDCHVLSCEVFKTIPVGTNIFYQPGGGGGEWEGRSNCPCYLKTIVFMNVKFFRVFKTRLGNAKIVYIVTMIVTPQRERKHLHLPCARRCQGQAILKAPHYHAEKMASARKQNDWPK